MGMAQRQCGSRRLVVTTTQRGNALCCFGGLLLYYARAGACNEILSSSLNLTSEQLGGIERHNAADGGEEDASNE